MSWRSALVLLAFASLSAPVLAQERSIVASGPAASRIDDRRLGEEEQIRRRTEWFFSTRRAGAASDRDLWRLRRDAVEQTRKAIERQRALRAAGVILEQNVWMPMGPAPSTFGGWAFGPVSGRVSSIAADWGGGAIYVATASGGLWKSTNDGLSYTQLFDTAGTMTVGTVAIDPTDPNVVWAGTGENNQSCESYFGIGLLRSQDGGVTWETRNGTAGSTLEDLSSFANLAIDPRNGDRIVTGGRIRGCSGGSQQNGGLYTTSDGGLTWNVRLSGTPVYEIARDPVRPDILWAGTGAGVYKSIDNGATWTLQTASGLPNGSPGRTEVAVAPSDPDTVYALFAGGPSFWRTTDGGTTWTQMSTGSDACDGQCSYNMVVRVHRTDPDTVFRGTVRIWKSLDGGATWADLSNAWGSSQKVHQDTHHFLMDPGDPQVFWVGCDGGVWKTTDGGGSFVNRNGNLNVTQFYAVGADASDPATLCGGAQDNSSLARTTSNTWALQAVTGDGFVCHIDPIDPSYAYITSYPSGGYPNVWRSTAGLFGGFTDITGAGSGVIGGERSAWVTPYVLDPVRPATLYLGTQRVYRSDDHGSTWMPLGPPDMTGGSGALIALDVNRGDIDYVHAGSSSGRVWRSTDGGAVWTEITAGLPPRAINDLAGVPSDPDRLVAVVGGFGTDHVWEWTSGTGWVPRSAGLPDVPTNTVLALTATDLMVGNDTGIFRSYDDGATWQPYMTGLPEGLVVTDLKYNQLQNVVTAGTYGRGAWQVSIDPVHPIVVYDSLDLPMTEVDGDGDDRVEPGETWEARPILRNAGGETAAGTEATIVAASAGVTILGHDVLTFGSIAPGATVAATSPVTFVVEPAFPCGADAVFDVVTVTTTNAPFVHADHPAAFVVNVSEADGTAIPSIELDEDFDPNPPSGWTHESINPLLLPCITLPYADEWSIASKDAAHGDSYHCGNGPGSSYSRRNFAWLYYGGKDSENGPGLVLSEDLVSATLTIEHWYETSAGGDGGQVAIDPSEDDTNTYTPLEPVGGYPGGTLANGNCNGLEGQEAFQGSSGGWVSSTFDLLPYKGRRVYLAFVFGSDMLLESGEGWYVDRVTVEVRRPGEPICHITTWPGSVSASARFTLFGGGEIEAVWGDSCNLGTSPGQTYSIQAGDLDLLASSGTYTHTPVGGACGRTSPARFPPGAGNEYYLVVPNDGGAHDGGAGEDSSGAPRPQVAATCGLRRAEACP